MSTVAADDMWLCCACNQYNYSANAPDRCSNYPCTHDRCYACIVGRPGLTSELSNYNSQLTSYNTFTAEAADSTSKGYTPPNYEPQSYNLGYGNERNYEYNSQPSSQYHYSDYDNSQYDDQDNNQHDDQGDNQTEYYETDPDPTLAPRYDPDYYPNMTGLWVCCECKQTNGPALTPERCSNCGHYKNICCSPA